MPFCAVNGRSGWGQGVELASVETATFYAPGKADTITDAVYTSRGYESGHGHAGGAAIRPSGCKRTLDHQAPIAQLDRAADF